MVETQRVDYTLVISFQGFFFVMPDEKVDEFSAVFSVFCAVMTKRRAVMEVNLKCSLAQVTGGWATESWSNVVDRFWAKPF